MTNKLPKISVVIVTYNNERTLAECLRRIKKQDYPRHLIEYINVDGGSTDDTKEILAKYKFQMIDSHIPKNAEVQRAIGIKNAKHNLIVSLDADNYLPHVRWLRQMVKPFMEDDRVIHAGTMHYGYSRKDSLYNRYCALFGVLDPIVYYVGRPDRVPQYQKQWTSGNIITETDEYYVVEFDESNLPTVGCNGVVYKRDILLKHARSDPSEFLHIDVFVDLLRKNYTRYAIVKNEVIHDTAVSLPMLLKKRILFLQAYYLRENRQRRYFIINPRKPRDVIKLFTFAIYTVTLIKPLIDSVWGYLHIRDITWFMHPLVCWVYLISYSIATVKRLSIIRA